MRGKCLMVQGTGSSVGKSILCAALLRILKQDGFSAAPFKAQNMALNSFVTEDGLEMGRAQVVQAQAAGVKPHVDMNPILLKPTSDKRSQVIVGGRVLSSMTAAEYHRRKPQLRQTVKAAYERLEQKHDFVIIEGAGSPAEINLRDGDLVNMAMAEMADAPVLLVGDINLGGVFASLFGTAMLVSPEEKKRIGGFVINKFRGDESLLTPGLRMLEKRVGIPTLGVVPWMDLDIEDEDSVTRRFEKASRGSGLRVAVVHLPHISNFTDFLPLSTQDGARVEYASSPDELEDADLIILPGTKNTIEDLLFLRKTGMDAPIVRHARAGKPVLGVCGGYQMLGMKLSDPDHVESSVPECAGLGLLDMEIVFRKEKITRQTTGVISGGGFLEPLRGARLDGYEIHAGESVFGKSAVPWLVIDGKTDGIRSEKGMVLGTHLHGLFDSGVLWQHLKGLCGGAPGNGEAMTLDAFRERELDRLAAVVRRSLKMDRVYALLKGEAI